MGKHYNICKILFFIIITFFASSTAMSDEGPYAPKSTFITGSDKGPCYYFKVKNTGEKGYFARDGVISQIMPLYYFSDLQSNKNFIRLAYVEKIIILNTWPLVYSGARKLPSWKYVKVELYIMGEKKPHIGFTSKFSLIPYKGADWIRVTARGQEGAILIKVGP